MDAQKRQRDGHAARQDRGRAKGAPCDLLHALALSIAGDEPGAHREAQEVKGQVEDGGVDERVAAPNRRDNREAQEPDVSEHHHEAQDAALADGRAHKGGDDQGDHNHERVGHARVEKGRHDVRAARELRGIEHRPHDHGGKGDRQHQVGEAFVKGRRREACLFAAVSGADDEEEHDHLSEDAEGVRVHARAFRCCDGRLSVGKLHSACTLAGKRMQKAM